MRNIRITIEGEQVDYDLQNLPLTFTRKLDLWDKFVGSEGDRPKPLGDTLYLPATKRNSLVMASFDNLNTTARERQGRLIIEILINGASVFVGFAERVSISKDHKLATKFALKILGEASSLFQKMNETSLRALEMGEADSTSTDITDSWVSLAVTGNPLVWAPLYYGGSTSIDTFVVGSGYRYYDGFRPSVRIWKIVEAMFAGYEIVSDMYESQMFRNLVYPFAVGDDWERNDAVAFYRCYVGDGTGEGIATFLPPTTTIKWIDESPPFFDPANLNDGLGNFTPAAYGSGWYQFTFRVDSNADNLQIVGTYPFGTQVLYEFPNTALALMTTVEPILFEPSSPNGLISIKFVLNKAVGNIDIYGQAVYRAELLQRFAYGQPLRIASCLHDKPQSQFWRGLQHAFGLVLAIDEVSKRVYFESRFNNVVDTFVNPEPPTGRLNCWYNGDNAQEIQADVSEVFVQHKRPFGDYLQLSYAESSSDALYGYIKEQAAGAYDDKPLLGSRINFTPTDAQGTTLPNPFFTYLLNTRIQSSSSDEGSRLGVFATIVDNLELLTQDFGRPVQPTFKGDPKLGMYYGLLDFSNPIYFSPIGQPLYAFGFVDDVSIRTIIPSIFQLYPDDDGYLAQMDEAFFSLSYSTLPYATIGGKVLGLIDRYHQKYLSIIHNDKFASVQAATNLDEYRSDFFRVPRILNIDGQRTKAWQVSTDSFEPLNSDIADVVLALDYERIDDGQGYDESPNEDKPLLTIGYTFTLTT